MYLTPWPPFGGHEQSGMGVENGIDDPLEYTYPQTITVRKTASAWRLPESGDEHGYPQGTGLCRQSRLRRGRIDAKRDVAGMAVFLCSDNARYVTGAICDCDGGAVLGDASGDALTVPAR
jgi:NAD(P)-dependent dehydrogenase (short-subunit alcohol dehydrogenase family)